MSGLERACSWFIAPSSGAPASGWSAPPPGSPSSECSGPPAGAVDPDLPAPAYEPRPHPPAADRPRRRKRPPRPVTRPPAHAGWQPPSADDPAGGGQENRPEGKEILATPLPVEPTDREDRTVPAAAASEVVAAGSPAAASEVVVTGSPAAASEVVVTGSPAAASAVVAAGSPAAASELVATGSPPALSDIVAAGPPAAVTSAAVLGRPGEVEPVAAALALALRLQTRAKAAAVAVVGAAPPAMEGTSSAAAARRLGARLEAHGHDVRVRGRLAWLELDPSDPHFAAVARRVTLVAAPAVLAVTAARTLAVDEALNEQDLLILVTGDPEGALAQLAVAGLTDVPILTTRPLGRGPARALSRAGVRPARTVRQMLTEVAR